MKPKTGKRIKYVVSYDCFENVNENRVNILASANKIDYIVKKINEAGYSVDLISTSQTLNKRFYRGKLIWRGENSLRLFPTTPRGGMFLRALNVCVMRLCIAIFFLRKVKRNEVIMIYHSVGNLWMIPFLKVLKKAHIIEEVEEIYGDILKKPRISMKEKKLLSKANAYIYPTKMLNEIVNYKNKPYLVVHGSYQKVRDYDAEKLREKDGRKHICYTGILDPKKGCLEFVRAGQYLDDSYHLHVLGFGSEAEVADLMREIETMNKTCTCVISYDGLKRGEDYEKYLQSMDVGSCPLDSEDPFTQTQFPSKVISYLANGLCVICSKVETVESSDVAECITFYEGSDSKSIADAIQKSKCNGDLSSIQVIEDRDVQFGTEIKKFLEKEFSV